MLLRKIGKKRAIIVAVIVILLIIVLVFLILNKKQFMFSFFSKLDYSKASKLFDSLKKTTSTNTFKDIELNPFKYNETE